MPSREVQLLREEADEAAENVELARLAAKTLEEQFRCEQAMVLRLQVWGSKTP